MSPVSTTPETIFNQAIAIADATDRAAFLDRSCANDPALRSEIEKLVNDHFRAGDFLEQPAVQLGVTTAQPAIERQGTQIGPYRLRQQIGEGGMGVVYMAEQLAPVERKVALKIIKPGMDSRQVIARFEAERQALALMDHPNIAKVLDAGTTESGRPYFVMELVKGVPITQYCDEHRLTPLQRLELFLSVCQAVQHAHQKGIIHRDIKPSNVLVAEFDEKPVAKIIDFGVAKAIGQRLTEKSLFTEFGQVVGTIEYMSPEQAKLNQLDIDTRTDVYALGVLLYELLTGETPFDRQRLRGAAFDEMLRIIREEEPPKPSTRLSSSGSLPSVAANRHLEPARLTALLRGDLDWIVMKALEKDRSRRYETANGLAMDVQRYLADEPVLACPPSRMYRFRKFARRNRVVITTATLVAAALVLGIIVSTWQAFRAEAARSEAQKQRELADANFEKARKAVDEYFTLVSESKLLDVPGMQPLRKELLEAALRYYQAMRNERADDPAVLADLVVAQIHVANVYHELDRNDDAVAAIELAVTLAERLRSDFPQAVEQHRRLAGYWKAERGISPSTKMPKDPVAAHRTLTRFLQLWEAFASENPSVEAFQNDVAAINKFLAALEGSRGAAGEPAALARALAYSGKAIAIWEQLSQAHPDVPRHRENLARAYGEMAEEFERAGEKERARAASARATALQEKLIKQFPSVPAYRDLTARKLMELGSSLADSRPADAETAFRQALQAWQKLAADFPAAHEYTIEFARAQFRFAETLAGPLKRPDDAIQVFREGNDMLKKLAAEFPDEPRYLRELAFAPRKLASRLGEYKACLGDAEKLHLQSLAACNLLAKKFPKELWYVEATGHSYRYLGWIARDTGRSAEAIDYFEKGIAAFQKLADADIPQKDGYYRGYLGDTLLQRMRVLAGAGRADDAEKTIRRAVDVYESLMRDYPDNSQWRQKAAGAVRDMADLLIKNGRQREAAEVYRAAIARVEKVAGGPRVEIYRGTLHRDSGKLDQAIADCSAAIAGEPGMVEAWDLRGSCYLRKSEFAKAADDYSEAIKLQPGNSWYWHESAFAYMALGKHRESIADHSEAIRLSDQDAGTRLRRGDCYRALGEWTKAETDYTRAIELDGGVWEAWHGRGLTYLQLKQNDKATTDFTKAIELKPDRWEGWSGRAFAYFHRQQWDRAVSDFSKAIDLAPQVHTNWFHRGHAYLNLAQWDKAVADFAKVVKQWPNDPEGWYLRGVAYAQSNQPDKALADLEQAIAKGFKDMDRIQNDPRLASLRSNADFKKLLTKFEKEKE